MLSVSREVKIGIPAQEIMRLKSVTFLAAITQLLRVLMSTFNYARMFQRLTWADNADFFVGQAIYVVADIMLVVFLFTLFARQKES